MKFALRISDFGALVGAIMLVTDIIMRFGFGKPTTHHAGTMLAVACAVRLFLEDREQREHERQNETPDDAPE